MDKAFSSTRLQSRARFALESYARKVRINAPRSNTSDPHMGDDWNVTGLSIGLGSTYLNAKVESINVDPGTGYNIPALVESGFRPHAVRLWLPPGIKPGEARVRKKLAEMIGAPTELESLKRYLTEEEKSPWITVSAPPRKFTEGPNARYITELADELLQATYESIYEIAWRG